MVIGGKHALKVYFACLLGSGLGPLAACGGRSVSYEGSGGEGAAADETSGRGGGGRGGGSSQNSYCESRCDDCGDEVERCNAICEQTQRVSEAAGCTQAFSTFADCAEKAGLCSAEDEGCTRETNALSVCLLDYCDFHPRECSVDFY